MTRRGAFLAIGFALLIALLWSRQSYEPLSYYSSRSYVQRTNDLIRKGALKYDCTDNRIKLTTSASDAEQKWFDASYLRNDVELYNRNRELFGHFFVVEDCQLREINPYLRTVRLPFAKATEWLGNIDYSGPPSESTLISSNGRAIALQRSQGDVPQTEVRTRVGSTQDVAANVVHIDFAGGSATPAVEVHSAAGTAVIEQRVKKGQPADVRLLGNAVPEGRIARLMSGDWLHLSSASRSETFLFTGEKRYERLSVMRLRNDELARTYEEDEPLLRWIGGEDGEQMLTFGEALARSITHALQQLAPARANELVSRFDVQLSIDRSLQAALDESLSAHAGALVRDAAGGDPFAASVTVMDGRTGEILAAASFPSQDDLENAQGISEDERRRLLVNHNFKRHPIGSAGKPFFYASIASRHPFLLDLTVEPHGPAEHPDGTQEGERELLHVFLGRDYRLWAHWDERIGMESALERSCNKFTVELATMALAAPADLRVRTLNRPLSQVFARQPEVQWPRPGASGGVQIAGQELDFPPSLRGFMPEIGKPVRPAENTTAVVHPGSLNRIDEAPFIETFETITGVRTYGGVAAPDIPAETSAIGRSAMVTMHYDLRPWRQLVERFTAGESEETRWKLRAAFQSVSPERVNLSLNQVTDVRTEFVSLLLGGSTSLWTNVQLAEGLSRLVTKREVEASMLHALRDRTQKAPAPPTPPQSFAPLDELSDEARATVLRGMARVVIGTRGTANRVLAPWVADLQQRFPGYKVAVYSKTGSPTVTRPEAKPIGQILPQLVTGAELRYVNGHLAVAPNRNRVVAYAPPASARRGEYLAALTTATRAAARRARQPFALTTARRIAAFTDRFERYRGRLTFDSPSAVRLSEGASLPFHVVAGSIVLNREHPIFDPITQTDSSAVYIVSLVKWKGAGDVPTPQELEQRDARVITAVFYYDIGPGSEVAVEAARAMLPRIAKLLE